MVTKQDGRAAALRTAAASVSVMLASPASERARRAAAAAKEAAQLLAEPLVDPHTAAHRQYKVDRVVDLTGELGEGPGKYHKVMRRVPRYETIWKRSEQRGSDYELYRAAKWLDEVNEMAQAGLTRSVLDMRGSHGAGYAGLAINERAARARIDVEWVDDLFTRSEQDLRRATPADLLLELRVLKAVIVDDQTFTEIGLTERPFVAPEIDERDPKAVKARLAEVKAHRLAVKRWASKVYRIAVNRLLLALRDRAPHWFAPPRPPRVRLDARVNLCGIETVLPDPALGS